ncbi:efflux RND transporter periplasmic adaptor subunit [Sandarakinorhabdus sp.]|uniref:efflux RND transporter periplasmic adaptor subunit n=1 Tax=Sandarakinorhabdus sp. TaxID=1916663 RepID=UPI00286EABBF|nr:efflux RND transporter periplasmic adaptor subunit [Sandarakinorhabdus sp.]
MTNKTSLFRRGGAVALALLLAACSSGDGDGESGGKKRPPQLVSAQAAAMEDFAPTLLALGTVTPSQSVAVRPRADGEIVGIAFREGDNVRAGQLLFRIDARQARAAVAQAEAEVKGAVAAERRATLDYQRAEALVAKGFVSTAARDLARANAWSARSQIETNRALLQSAQVQLSFLTVKAPISGRTGELGFRLGANVRQGDATALVTINQIAPIHVRFLVPAANVQQARAVMAGGGGSVIVRDRQAGTTLATGRLVFLDNNVDPGNGGVAARAEFRNEGDVLWPGAIVDVLFPLGAPVQHIALPEGAVQTGRDAPFVWTVATGGPKPPGAGGADAKGIGGKIAMRNVEVAGRLDGKVYLASGVKPGEQVIVDALARLKEGDSVRLKGPPKPQVAGNAARPQSGPQTGSAG